MANDSKGTLTSSDLNYGNAESIRENLDLLSPVQQRLFHSAFSDYKRDDHRYQESYFQNAGFIVGAEPVFAHKFCLCGIPNLVNRSGRCGKRHFCPRCSYAKFFKHWKAFEQSFSSDSFYFVTFSYTGNVGFDSGGIQSCTLHWNAIQSAVNSLLHDHTLNGGIISEELSVRSLSPTLVLPHAHAVVGADTFGEEEIQRAVQLIKDYREDGEGVTMVPSVQATLVQDFRSFQNELSYLFKPVNLKTAYDSGWLEVEAGQKEAWRLNSAVQDFFTGHTELTKGRMMVKRFGNMHAHSKRFIGTRLARKCQSKSVLRRKRA